MKLKKLENYCKQALAVAEQSPDEQTKVGALLIHGRTGAVLSSGFNGFVRGACDNKLPKTRPDKYPYMVHAEINLITNGFRHGVTAEGCFVFCTLSPCINCCRALYQSGIVTVVFKDRYKDFDAQAAMLDLTWDLTSAGDYTIMNLKPRE